uniref:SJCHGC09017 protein n=1 Tax=Schistosoma japonicum TaxID=6182 RepID=Q5DGM4_SCHJA|nr:SJCHGC09017 protein [Schistosoma japonicum]
MFINKLNSRINWKITLHFILLLKYSSIATEYQLNITTLNSRQQTKYAKNSLNTFINSLIQSYKIHHHHHDHHHHDQSKLSLDVEQMNNSMKNTQSELKQLKNIDMNKNNDVNEAIMHGNHHLHEISYFKDNPRYANKTVCKSEYTWKDITIPWRILMKNFNSNCTHILGNLIISELDEDDDITLLEKIEEIFGYLVIYRVGRKELRLPRLKLIRGHEFVSFKSKKVALLVVSNYKQSTEQNDAFNQLQPSSLSSSSSSSSNSFLNENSSSKDTVNLRHSFRHL